MRIAVYTGNQPRHLGFIEKLAEHFRDVYVVQEATTLFTGAVQDHYQKSPLMEQYFQLMQASERKYFSEPRFLPGQVKTLAIKPGDLSNLPLWWLTPALDADIHIVFGASYIKGPLVEVLIERKAINIHMGVSPYYRGSACNFWALHDRRPDMVGATIHRISRGLDTGKMLFHVLPKPQQVSAMDLGMLAVQAAQSAVISAIRDGSLGAYEEVPQSRDLQLRYSRKADFTDQVAAEYMSAMPSADDVFKALINRNSEAFVRPKII